MRWDLALPLTLVLMTCSLAYLALYRPLQAQEQALLDQRQDLQEILAQIEQGRTPKLQQQVRAAEIHMTALEDPARTARLVEQQLVEVGFSTVSRRRGGEEEDSQDEAVPASWIITASGDYPAVVQLASRLDRLGLTPAFDRVAVRRTEAGVMLELRLGRLPQEHHQEEESRQVLPDGLGGLMQ